MPRLTTLTDCFVALDALRVIRPTLPPSLGPLADTALASGEQWRTLQEASAPAAAASTEASRDVLAQGRTLNRALRDFVWSIGRGTGAPISRELAADLGGVLPGRIALLRPDERAPVVRRLLAVSASRPSLAGDPALRASLASSVDALELALALRREASNREREALSSAASARGAWDAAWHRLVRMADALAGEPVAWAPRRSRRVVKAA
jgi:hypothetical protein